MTEKGRRSFTQNDLFLLFAAGLFVIMVLTGAGTMATVLWGNHALALRMINIFAAMFSGVLGLGSGYILGARATEETLAGTTGTDEETTTDSTEEEA